MHCFSLTDSEVSKLENKIPHWKELSLLIVEIDIF